MTGLDAAIAFTAAQEGADLDLNPNDPGNWTGGAIGKGRLRGSRFGISSARYPQLDMRTLTLAQARKLYRADYWVPIAGDALPPGLAVVMLDTSVHHGWPRAVKWLQSAVGARQVGGQVGPATLATMNAAIEREGVTVIARRVFAMREAYLRSLPSWRRFGGGWTRRLCALRQHLGRPAELSRELASLASERLAQAVAISRRYACRWERTTGPGGPPSRAAA
jgi:lysozyme family protein